MGRKTAAGAFWLSAASAVVQFLALAATAVVARHLGEAEYGTAGMAMVVVAFASVFVTFGFAPAIASGRLQSADGLCTAHWLVTAGGVLAAALISACSHLAAGFFANGAVTALLLVASLNLITGAWEVTPQAALQAAGRFDRIACVTVVGQALTTGLAIAMVLLGAGVWALVLPSLVGSAVRAAAFTGVAPMRLFAGLRLGSIRPFLGEFGHVSGTAVTDYLFFNADKVIIGRVLGTDALGRYNFAYGLVNRSLAMFTRTLGAPLLVSLGQLRDDPARFDRAVVRAVLATARLTMPVAIGGAIVAPELVRVVFGAHWEGAAWVVRLFFVLGAIQSLGHLTGSVWLSLGRARLLFLYGLVSNSLLVGAFAIGAWFGSPETVVVAFILYSLVPGLLACYLLTRRFCGVRLRGLGPGLIAVIRDLVAMTLVVLAAREALYGAGWPDAAVLVAQVLFGAAAYVLLFRLVSASEMSELVSLFPAGICNRLRYVLRLEQSHALSFAR